MNFTKNGKLEGKKDKLEENTDRENKRKTGRQRGRDQLYVNAQRGPPPYISVRDIVSLVMCTFIAMKDQLDIGLFRHNCRW